MLAVLDDTSAGPPFTDYAGPELLYTAAEAGRMRALHRIAGHETEARTS